MNYIYLDDVRTPSPNPATHEIPEWIVVRSYDEFVNKVQEIGLENVKMISLDHDLGDTAMNEYFNNVSPNYNLDYNNIKEKTGYDCAKWLCLYCEMHNLQLPPYNIQSGNSVGKENIDKYLQNYKKHMQ